MQKLSSTDVVRAVPDRCDQWRSRYTVRKVRTHPVLGKYSMFRKNTPFCFLA